MTKLYTDTSANLPLALLREYDIAVIPFSYTVNGVAEDYNEETDFDGKAFYDAMRRGAEVKTSMVNPATAAAFFERALAQGDEHGGLRRSREFLELLFRGKEFAVVFAPAAHKAELLLFRRYSYHEHRAAEPHGQVLKIIVVVRHGDAGGRV